MVNVRWVDKFPEDDLINDVIKDYKSSDLSMNEIADKYDISYSKLYSIVRANTDFRRKNKPKYYHFAKDKNRWVVLRYINKKDIWFGSYKSEKEAQDIVEWLEQNDWDKNKLPEKQGRDYPYKGGYLNPAHYNKQGKYFTVRKTINGKRYTYGSYRSEEQAKYIVDRLKSVNWDKSQLNKFRSEIGINRKLNV